MIVAQRKDLQKIEAMVDGFSKVLILGCGTCVAVCMAGGEKEVEILAQELRMKAKLAGKNVVFDEKTLTRQCDKEYLDEIAGKAGDYDAILSMACGVGVQFLAERYGDKVVLPAVDTRFLGANEGAGEWSERCIACNDCVLDRTGGICPMTICAKSQLNGPCGGTHHGKCEVDSNKDCAWTLIYNKLKKLDRLDYIRTIFAPKNNYNKTHPSRYKHVAFEEQQAQEGGK